MTSGEWSRFVPEWVPGSRQLFGEVGSALPAIVQLGFALTLGVVLDTFVVRPILVPAFLALLCRFQSARPRRGKRADDNQAPSHGGPHQRRANAIRVSA
jgi:RND superfamily putative drug exporter